MSHLFFAILDQAPANLGQELGRMSPQARERLLIFGAVGLVILSVTFWAVFFRKKPRRKRSHIKRNRVSLGKNLATGWAELKRVFAMRDRQRKRTRHRPRNPTRAEVGGLPESRDAADADAGSASNSHSNF